VGHRDQFANVRSLGGWVRARANHFLPTYGPFLFWSLLLTQLKAEPGRVVLELIDARQYLSDSGSAMDTTMVDALDILHAHAQWDAKDLIPGGTNTLRVGRETLDLENRRLVARNAFRNTINAFASVDWFWEADGGGSVRAFYFYRSGGCWRIGGHSWITTS